MNTLDTDLDESALFCKSLNQKRKAGGNDNPKSSKQLKLQFSQVSSKTNEDQIEGVKSDNLPGEKTRATKSQHLNSVYDESKSSYFSVPKSVNTCPLCLKSFKTDSAYSGHMKQCAKTHKMTTQQLLGALELQKKQMQERRALGLCSQKTASPPKTTMKKKKEKETEQYDLALGLALSRSLNTGDAKVTLSEVQKSLSSQTLEEFGFTAKNAVAGPSRRKNEVDRKSILRERKVEERQRIIIEKVAVVLLDENQEPKSENNHQNLNFRLQDDQVPQLWNMGENNENRGWYVQGIKTLILTEDESTKESTQPSNSHGDGIENEISRLNLPRHDVHKDWTKMINNSKLSDLTATTKDCQDVHLHTLVLFAKCPEILEKDCGTVFRKFNLSTILVFLEFVYCGTLDGLSRTEVDKLWDLAVEFNYDELITVLNCLKSNLNGDGEPISNSDPVAEVVETEVKHPEREGIESKQATVLEDRDLFTGDDVVESTMKNNESVNDENCVENESNAEKSYWSFIQHEKKKSEEMRKSISTEMDIFNEEGESATDKQSLNGKQLQRNMSDDSATRDLDEELKKSDNANSDCIILSSGSESRTPENLPRAAHSRTPTPVNVDYEVPEFDPYDNFNFFSEEQFSPVGVHSQSLITGDISIESLKSSERQNGRRLDGFAEEQPKKSVGYCSTPVAGHKSGQIKSTNSVDMSRKRKTRDPSASRILRKSLGLQQKRRISVSTSVKKINLKKKENRNDRDLAEALTNSILHELSRSSAFQSSPPARRNMFVEMTPISSRDEFLDNVTPSPNYSNMGESLIKEQLTKYGLKKNLAKSKAKKILRYIYEELHPLYNPETGKIVKKLHNNTPKPGKKSNSKPNANTKKVKSDGSGKNKQGRKEKNNCHSSQESEVGRMSGESIDRLSDYDSDESEFENLSETLTQSTPSNPVDLASAFCDFLLYNPDYHQKILVYEPIWLEELQKKLKEAFKKHFKIADLMDFLDQKCITFRSEAQAKTNLKRNEKKKENLKKKKTSS